MNDTTALLPDIKLRFNIEHPSFEECYAYGYECALAEVAEEANPYREDSKESEQWLEGWWAGFYGEKSLYELDDKEDQEQTDAISAANDNTYHDHGLGLVIRVMEYTGLLAVSAAVGYQLLDLVA